MTSAMHVHFHVQLSLQENAKIDPQQIRGEILHHLTTETAVEGGISDVIVSEVDSIKEYKAE